MEKELQHHIKLKKGDIGEYVILPGDPGRCKQIAKHFDNPKKIKEFREYVTYTGYLDGTKVSVTSTGIGGPSAAIAMEELTKIGAHTFIRVGTSGGMDTKVKGGDVVIATGAIRQEGTGREYIPIEYPAVANYEIVNALIEAAEDQNKEYHVGVVECKDSYYGQHEPNSKPVHVELKNNWQAWIDSGALASEMESATLFIVASYLKVRVGTVLLVARNHEREKKGMNNPTTFDSEISIEVGIDALKNIIKKDKKKV